jgi:glucokinase
MLLPFRIPKGSKVNKKSSIVLAGDIGATKTNLALYKVKGDIIVSLKEERYKSNDYKNIIDLTEVFMNGFTLPDSICFGVAGPVLQGNAKLLNINWNINSAEISRHFRVKKADLINDLEATAYGLAILTEKDIAVISKGVDKIEGNSAIIAPGTGLGEAGLYWDGNYFQPIATEGGHCDFAPRNEFDFELYSFLSKKFGHVSWERLVSGPGIINIYEFLRSEKKMEEPDWLKTAYINNDAAAVISQHVNESPICKETMRLFMRYLALESANLVLKFKATRGLFIGGGIAPKILSLFTKDTFSSFFYQSGRMSSILEMVPVKVIINTKTALLGAAFYGSKKAML